MYKLIATFQDGDTREKTGDQEPIESLYDRLYDRLGNDVFALAIYNGSELIDYIEY